MNIFPSLQSWCKILVLVKVQIILITFISSIAEAFNMSWFTKWFPDCLVFPVSLPYVVGQSGPRVAYSAWARSLLPPPPSTSGPFYPMSLFAPPPLSSSHLKRQYLTGSSSHQIRDITSYCHNAIFTRCSWSVCDHKKPGRFLFLDFPLYQELS